MVEYSRSELIRQESDTSWVDLNEIVHMDNILKTNVVVKYLTQKNTFHIIHKKRYFGVQKKIGDIRALEKHSALVG